MKRLVLLPGMDGTGELFADFQQAVSGKCQTTVLRYPADRFLSYSQLLDYISAYVPADEPFTLLAESFSTPLAIQFAVSNPTGLRALVLCAGFVTCPVNYWLGLMAGVAARFAFQMKLPDFAVDFLLGPAPPADLVVALRSAISSTSPRVLSRRLQAVLTCDARADLSRLTVPTLYIQARHDRLVRPQCLKEMQRIKPDINVTAIDGSHLILQQEPIEAAEAIMEFISKAG